MRSVPEPQSGDESLCTGVAFNQENAFYLVTVKILDIPSYAELYLHTVNRDQISLENRSIATLLCHARHCPVHN